MASISTVFLFFLYFPKVNKHSLCDMFTGWRASSWVKYIWLQTSLSDNAETLADIEDEIKELEGKLKRAERSKGNLTYERDTLSSQQVNFRSELCGACRLQL